MKGNNLTNLPTSPIPSFGWLSGACPVKPGTLWVFNWGGSLTPEDLKDVVSRYAEKAGLYVLTQTIDGGAALVNRKNFRAKEFN